MLRIKVRGPTTYCITEQFYRMGKYSCLNSLVKEASMNILSCIPGLKSSIRQNLFLVMWPTKKVWLAVGTFQSHDKVHGLEVRIQEDPD